MLCPMKLIMASHLEREEYQNRFYQCEEKKCEWWVEQHHTEYEKYGKDGKPKVFDDSCCAIKLIAEK